ncbi:hypothetical protein M407DRAFT_20207 [Tulasnella calospora MUT 4182]|uniref:Peptidase S8/S53 domain-containing protein n=1 Tax=Tulasnella calospora MUT 4182 TaxID=1051891 RepID=A0A0C3QRZ6_9AGAM|nr:hypothetical protein M407DRAFT_20207 [Tulasnella calospora MUT 4182]
MGRFASGICHSYEDLQLRVPDQASGLFLLPRYSSPAKTLPTKHNFAAFIIPSVNPAEHVVFKWLTPAKLPTPKSHFLDFPFPFPFPFSFPSVNQRSTQSMKYLQALAAAASLSLVSATVDFQSVKPLAISDGDTILGAYFVELDQPSGVHGRFSNQNNTAHHALYSSLDKCGAKWSLREEFNSPGMFVGATVNLESNKDLAILADIPNVIAISPIYVHRAPQLTESRDLVLETAYAFDTFAPHVMTGVDKLHAQGFLGEGIKIALIDSGVDYRHPALGGKFGAGQKISTIVDLSKDKSEVDGVHVPDCEGHGTHVAGIVGANPNSHGFTGVAPKATLAMYKIHGCSKSYDDEVLMKALQAAEQEKYDIISMSIGSAGRAWAKTVPAAFAAKLAAAGVVVVAAAGNDGRFGPFYTNSPSAGKGVISVASIENTDILVQKAELDNGHAPINYFSVDPLPIQGAWPICAISSNPKDANQACKALPDSIQLSDCVVIVRAGGCQLSEKIAHLLDRGAQYALFYDTSGTPPYQESPGIISAMISKDDGENLVNMSGQDVVPKLRFPQRKKPTVIPNPLGGLAAFSSSYGPTWDLEFKPSVAAPGTRILSTVPVKNNKAMYGMKSGTSMATPLVAGVAALLLEKHGKTKSNALGMRYLLESTANIVPSSKESGKPLQTVAKTGAGMVDAFKAMYGHTIVTPGEILLRDSSHVSPKNHAITIKNTSKKAQTYKLTHVPAGTMNTFGLHQQAIPGDAPLSNDHAYVTFHTQKKLNTIMVPPGQSRMVYVDIYQPKGVDAKKLPVFGGFLKIESASDSVHVSYMGVVGEMKALQVLDRTSDVFGVAMPFVAGAGKKITKLKDAKDTTGATTNKGNIQKGSKTYGWKSATDFPVIYYRFLTGTAEVRIDLVDSNFKLKTPLPKGQIKDQLLSSEYQPRNTQGTLDENGWEELRLKKPTFSDGKTKIKNGNYKILIRALRVGGNLNTDSDYDSWLSPEIIINHN